MSLSIKCTSCGAVLKSKTDIPAGKKIKCPKCAKVFVVEEEEEQEEPEEEEYADEEAADEGESPDEDEDSPAKGADEDAEDEEDSEEEEEDEAPKSKKPAKTADDDEEEEESEEEEEKPRSKKPAKAAADDEEEDESEDDEEDEKPKQKAKVVAKSKKKKGADDEEDDDEKPKKKSSMGLILGLVGGALLLCFCCGAPAAWVGFGGLNTKPSVPDTDKGLAVAKDGDKGKDKDAKGKIVPDSPPPPFGKADFTSKSFDIAREFTDKYREANQKYLGKTVEITGQVVSVSYVGEAKRLGVRLGGDGNNLIEVPIQESDLGKCAALAPEQKVKVVGTFKEHSGSVLHFSLGRLAEDGPPNPAKLIQATSEMLAADYYKLPATADEKYQGKMLVITGEVIELQATKAKLKGTAKLPVLVELDEFNAAKLQQGKTAIVRAEFFDVNLDNRQVTLTVVVVVDGKAVRAP